MKHKKPFSARAAALLTATALTMALTACGNSGSGSVSSAASGKDTAPASGSQAPAASAPDAQAAYAPVLERWRTALTERWDNGTLYDAGMGDLMADCYGDAPQQNVGYALQDLDGDGREELLIGTIGAEEGSFYDRLALALYTLDDTGAPQEVFVTIARSRYYTMGGGQFAYYGSNGADDSTEVTVTYAGGTLAETGGAADPAAYVQWELRTFE